MTYKIVFGPYDFANQCTDLCANIKKYTNFQVDQYILKYGNDSDYNNFKNLLENKKYKNLNINKKFISDYQLKIVKHLCKNKPDLINFWHRPFLYQPSQNYFQFSGLDMAIFKSNKISISSRFCGYELRDPKIEDELNPYNPRKFGWKNPHNSFSRNLTEQMILNSNFSFVTDEEMYSHIQSDKKFIVPRIIDRKTIFNQFSMRKTKKDFFKIVHAPSNTKLKGTEFIRKAISKIKNKNVKYVELNGENRHKILSELSTADLAIDQMLIGWYGVFALEALSFGCPVICYIRPDLEKKFNNSPIFTADIIDLKKKIELAIDQVFYEKEELKSKCFEYIDKNHDPERVVKIYEKIIQDSLDKKEDNIFKIYSLREDYIQDEKVDKNFSISLKILYLVRKFFNLVRKFFNKVKRKIYRDFIN